MLCGMSTNETINRSIDRFTIPIMVFVSHLVQLQLERYMCPRVHRLRRIREVQNRHLLQDQID